MNGSTPATTKEVTDGSASSSDEDGKAKESPPVASVREVFSFARTRKVKIYIAFSFFFSAVSGCVMPAMAFYFAKAFEDLAASTDSSAFLGGVRNVAYSFMILGAIILVSMTLQSMLMETAAGEMTREMKNAWFRALLRQDMAYYDIRDVPGQATLISSNGAKYRKGVGRKLSEAVQFFVACVGAVAYSFYASWQVTLALTAIAPFLFLSTYYIVKITTTQTARSNKSYAKAGSVVSNTVRSIRTVLSLNAVEDMIERYQIATREACDSARGSAWILGLANGGNMVSMLLAYILVTLFGSWLIYRNVRADGCDPSATVEGADACYPSGNDVFGALFGVSIAASVLPQVSIALEKFAGARSACYPALVAMSRALPSEPSESGSKDPELGGTSSHAIRKEVESLPKYSIDSMSPRGFQPSDVKGEIEFRNVTFAYPARPEVSALKSFSLKIPAGRTVALVGPSGSGKSTVTALLERFYDPTSGSVTLDGTDLKLLNVKWLRDQIGLVMQEPKLFGKTIRENISLGSPGVTPAQVEEAARLANAHDFIMSFPKGYDTQVGDLGGMLSGGQRQRVAIARVLVRAPSVLILDEATSALDSESEAAVQQALDGLMAKRSATTIVIAHRLSTIKNADMIAVVKDGQIAETGTHNELLALDGEYASLVKAQKTKASIESKVETDSEPKSEPVSRQESMNDDFEVPTSTTQESTAVFQFRDVHFRYPSRPDVEVFRGLNLSVRQGETLALVGPSGCGKSSLIQLMEHFYQPSGKGSVLYHGVDLKRINVRWLRSQIGLVGQEAVLFTGTIEENIKLGYAEATTEQVIEAARQANCHDFIVSFPEGYKTQVGEGGTLVSGGQKQRIGIARAILRRPKVLLLDEATSALDSNSERIVQEALDKIMADKEQTVVVIAHRLSTIRNADRIAVIEHGKVKELGTHEELMQKPDGLYRRLQQMQNLDTADHGLAARDDLGHVTEPTEGANKIEAEGKDDLEPSKEQIASNSRRAWLLGKRYMSFILVGTVGAFLSGLFFPAWGITFAYMIELFYRRVECPPIPDGFGTCDIYFDAQAQAMQTLSLQIFYGYLGLCVTAVVGNILLFYGFGSASEKMNKNVRDSAFTSLVRQEVAWFDMRAPGTITSQLADDAAMLHAFAGEPIRTITVSVSSVIVGLVISFVYMWPFALLTLGILPFLAFGAEMEMRTYLGEDEPEETQDEHSPGGIVIETLSSIRTVASLTLESERAAEYDQALQHEDPHPMRTNLVKGSLAGTGQFLQMWSFAIMFWFGGYLLLNFPGSFSYNAYLISMFSLFFSMYGLTLAFQGSVDREKAKAAAHRIFALIDRKSLIDPLSDEGAIILDDGKLHSAPHAGYESTEKEDWVEVTF